MCNHANREAAMTVLDEKTWCDPCLAPLVKALNDSGIRTTSSCCGHHHRPGWVSLADGRWLMIAPDDEWMDWLSSRIYERVGDMPGHEPIYVPDNATEREALAKAWDEGAKCAGSYGHEDDWTHDMHPFDDNPYRTPPTTPEETQP